MAKSDAVEVGSVWIEELVEVRKWDWRVETTPSLTVESKSRLFGGRACEIDEVFLYF